MWKAILITILENPKFSQNYQELEMLYLSSTFNFGILPVLVFQLEVFYKVDRLLSGLTA